MAFVSDEELNAIRSKVNIVDVIGKSIPLTQRGKNYFCVCPFHDDHSPSMSVSADKQIYKCFSCGASGNVFTFVQNFENVSWMEAVAIVANMAGVSVNVGHVVKVNDSFKEEYAMMDLANKFYQNNLNSQEGIKAKEYLRERGLDDEAISEFGVGLSLDRNDGILTLLTKKGHGKEKIIEVGLANNENYDTFVRRIVFPLWNKDGQVIGFSGRIYRGEEGAKYANSKESKIFKKGELLYNYHRAKDIAKREKYILVVEGFMDAIRLSTMGIRNVVALMGTSMTTDHVQLLKKLRVKVVLCLDNDSAGILASVNNGAMLTKAKIDTYVIRLSGAKDPDEYIIKNGVDDFKELLKEPMSYFDFRLRHCKETKDLTNAKDLAAYINEVIELVKEVDDDILREITLNNLSKEYNIDVNLLKERVKFEGEHERRVIVNTKKEVVKKKSALDESAKKILYYMMNDRKYVNLYRKKLGYIENAELRGIANEILYYNEKSGGINIADFITYMSNKEQVEIVKEITADVVLEELDEGSMLEIINTYYRLMVKGQINSLKCALKDEVDINKKMEIVKRITELKKGCVGNGRD